MSTICGFSNYNEYENYATFKLHSARPQDEHKLW